MRPTPSIDRGGTCPSRASQRRCGPQCQPPAIRRHRSGGSVNEIDYNNCIIAIEDIPPKKPHAPLIVNDTEDDDNDDNNATGNGNDINDVDVDEDEDYNDSSNKDDNNKPAAETDVQEGNESDGDQGVQRLQCRGKGASKKYADYSLLMASRGTTSGSHS